jgi:hypothetical protein
VGPSTKIYISIPNMSGFKDYLQSDVIHFMAEKPLSQTALDNGKESSSSNRNFMFLNLHLKSEKMKKFSNLTVVVSEDKSFEIFPFTILVHNCIKIAPVSFKNFMKMF